MRESAWQIRWNPLGESPRVLLDWGDLMEGEIERDMEQLLDVGRFDFATSGTVVGRRNVKRRLTFTRRDPQASAAESWEACSAAVLAGPWREKGLLSVRPLNGTEKLFLAALLSTSHEPDTGHAGPESVHQFNLRVTPYPLVATGDGVTIIGGIYNPPTDGHGGTVTVYLPPGHGITPGGTVLVTGVPGVVPGYYHVRGVYPGGSTGSGGTGQDGVELDIPHDEEPYDGHINVDMENDVASSPYPNSNPGAYWAAAVDARVHVVTDVAIEVFRRDTGTGAFGWFSYGAGAHDFNSGQYGEPPESLAHYSGLAVDHPSQPVSFPSASLVFKWRRMGGGVQSLVTPINASGTVTYHGGVETVQSFHMPTASLSISAFGYTGGVVGTLPGGGTVTPVAPP